MGMKRIFGSCLADDQDDEDAKQRELEQARAANRIVFPDENDALKNASVVGNADFAKESPWMKEAAADAKKVQKMKREASKPAERPEKASKFAKKEKEPSEKKLFGAANKGNQNSMFFSFRNMFEDKKEAKTEVDGAVAGNPPAEVPPEKKEYVRPTLRKEQSVAVFASKFETGQVEAEAATSYQSEFDKEREALKAAQAQAVADRQKQLESNEAKMLMTDEFKVKMGLDKRKVNYQPRGGKVARLQRDLAGSTAHFQVPAGMREED
mmetsp:Transcript_22512/g.38874  ORF Transcript_22512/g.38874 Transcript_22512/m.38874 type:complete len:267 (-) Transcript_22512:112-912(-)